MRAAWTGQWPGTDRPLRVEAAAWHGKPVFFRLIGPWTRPSRMRPYEVSTAKKASNIIEGVLFLVVLAAAAALARRQYKRGKGDRQGAYRLALFVFVLQMAIWLCYGHFVPDPDILIGGFALAVSTALFMSGISWLFYMALEPYVRRLWPQTIISWTRVVSGRVRDPLVGRDVLFGVMLGLSWLLIYEIRLAFGIGRLGLAPVICSSDYLLGLRRTIGAWIVLVPGGIQGTLFFFIILIVLRYLLRKPWAAGVGFAAIFTFLHVIGTQHPLVETSSAVLIYGIAAFALVRFGLISLAFAVFVANLTMNLPFTFDFSRWYASFALSAAGAGFGRSCVGLSHRARRKQANQGRNAGVRASPQILG